jgi:serine/threonine protein kinase
LPRAERKKLSGNVGTIEYRAPEVIVLHLTSQRRRGIAYDERVDIWSFGMVCMRVCGCSVCLIVCVKVLFEVISLLIPYRFERVNPFELPELIARGVRPKLPAHVYVDPAVPGEAAADGAAAGGGASGGVPTSASTDEANDDDANDEAHSAGWL